MRIRTDEEAAHDDVAVLLAAGRFADALVPAALQAERLGVRPRSLTFLAGIVRRGGTAFAAGLPEPLPDQNQTLRVRPWLLAAAEAPVADDPPSPSAPGPTLPSVAGPPSPSAPPSLPDADLRLARWLDGVAVLIEGRRAAAAFS
ncbi:hypothetical protein [Actinoplanes sp. CA-252034]|uniref:hypothetical protein n=1 Tax=Actinoplanes sp. CA-252034 TaxID=3239906 RepID=UPI003D9957B7